MPTTASGALPETLFSLVAPPFCKSPRAAERVCESISRYIAKRLFLKVNCEKTNVGSVNGLKYLGYSFYT